MAVDESRTLPGFSLPVEDAEDGPILVVDGQPDWPLCVVVNAAVRGQLSDIDALLLGNEPFAVGSLEVTRPSPTLDLSEQIEKFLASSGHELEDMEAAGGWVVMDGEPYPARMILDVLGALDEERARWRRAKARAEDARRAWERYRSYVSNADPLFRSDADADASPGPGMREALLELEARAALVDQLAAELAARPAGAAAEVARTAGAEVAARTAGPAAEVAARTAEVAARTAEVAARTAGPAVDVAALTAEVAAHPAGPAADVAGRPAGAVADGDIPLSVSIAVKRRFLHVELVAVGLFDDSAFDAKLRHLDAWGCTELARYLQATRAFVAYMASPARAKFAPGLPSYPPSGGARLSIDWFRAPRPIPPKVVVGPLEWAAWCEREADDCLSRDHGEAGAGMWYWHSGNVSHTFYWRRDDGLSPCVYRVD